MKMADRVVSFGMDGIPFSKKQRQGNRSECAACDGDVVQLAKNKVVIKTVRLNATKSPNDEIQLCSDHCSCHMCGRKDNIIAISRVSDSTGKGYKGLCSMCACDAVKQPHRLVHGKFNTPQVCGPMSFGSGLRNCIKDETEHQGFKVCIVHARCAVCHNYFGNGSNSRLVLMESGIEKKMRILCKEHKREYGTDRAGRVFKSATYTVARGLGIYMPKPRLATNNDIDRKYNKY